jgi:hypothetical protein
VKVIDDDKLQDGMHTRWDTQRLKQHVHEFTSQVKPSLVSTCAFFFLSFFQRTAVANAPSGKHVVIDSAWCD